MESGQRSFPVEDQHGRLAGLVSLTDLQKVPAANRHGTAVREVMTPADRLIKVAPATDSMEALALLGRGDLNQLPVVENDRFIGLVRREDILKWLSLHFRSDGKPPA
jgi:CBS domain-containing protein